MGQWEWSFQRDPDPFQSNIKIENVGQGLINCQFYLIYFLNKNYGRGTTNRTVSLRFYFQLSSFCFFFFGSLSVFVLLFFWTFRLLLIKKTLYLSFVKVQKMTLPHIWTHFIWLNIILWTWLLTNKFLMKRIFSTTLYIERGILMSLKVNTTSNVLGNFIYFSHKISKVI